MDKYKLTLGEMNLMVAAVEHGFRSCERGDNLEMALLKALDLYEVEKPKARERA